MWEKQHLGIEMDDERRIKLREPCKQHKKCTFFSGRKEVPNKIAIETFVSS